MLLIFFSPWCETYVKKTLPETAAACRRVREQAEALSAKGDVRLLGLSWGIWENAADLKAYQAMYNVTIPLALDATGDIFRAYKVTQMPTIVVLGPNGREVRRMSGTLDDLVSLLMKARS